MQSLEVATQERSKEGERKAMARRRERRWRSNMA
jgi:hypothetical protein